MSVVKNEHDLQFPALEELLRLGHRGASLGVDVAQNLLEIANRLESLGGADANQNLASRCRELRERARLLEMRIAMIESRRAFAAQMANAVREDPLGRHLSVLKRLDSSLGEDGMARAS